MPWVKLDDRFPSHRKVALLTDRAFRLHVSALCWASENLTDGRIADRELPLVAKVRNVKATAQQLAEAGVWDRIEGGWEIHDYLDYNPSREQVLVERKKNAERQERFRRRKNGKPTPPGNGSSNGVTPEGSDAPGEHDGDTTEARRRHDGDTTATGSRREEPSDPQVTGIRNGVTNGAPSRPVPTPTPSMADVCGEGARSTRADAASLAPIDAANFTLTDGMRRWAHRDGYASLIDIDHSTQQFVSHYRSTGAQRKSWPDAWQKWIRDDAKRAAERRQRATTPSNVIQLPSGQPLTGTDATVAGWAALATPPSEDSA
ncbi:hypothetical protein ACFWR9_09005 [Streptomyces sp. NPDC058534]|uniref:hypothetical protein n=1 Tax=Streptomyces sp. NPDC058534 TaxID=3346541 RepID=UPI003665B517